MTMSKGATAGGAGKRRKNGFLEGNFRPISREQVYANLRVEGTLPDHLDGMYVRNGTNARWPLSGAAHMFDGDAMLHCVRIASGRAHFYANHWVRTPRFMQNETLGQDPRPTFGDMSRGGPEVMRRLADFRERMERGEIPALPGGHSANPSTSTCYIGGELYCVVEVAPPFRVFIDPDTGRVEGGGWNDFDGALPVFTAHHKICPKTGELHFIARPRMSAPASGASHGAADGSHDPSMAVYGVIDPQVRLVHQLPFPLGKPVPAFLHDYFLTERFVVVVDHSLRFDPQKLATTGMTDFRADMPLRFGVIPRRAERAADIRWFDTGHPGFCWHVLAGWEESSARGERLVLWLPTFDHYPSTIPIHLAEEPESRLRKVVLDLATGEVEQDRVARGMEHVAVERCDVNRMKLGGAQRFGYLMKRAQGQPMYDGFVKYDLHKERVDAVVEYGVGQLGGECLFVPAEGGAEDEGYLLDIVYDTVRESSELRIWEAHRIGEGRTEPVARIHLPQRVPYGVHGNWLRADELMQQARRPAPLADFG